MNCTYLTTVDMGNGVKTIGEYAFKNCTSLSSPKMSEYIGKICAYAFENCSSLKTIYFPLSLSRIESMAFYNSGITTVKYEGSSSLDFSGSVYVSSTGNDRIIYASFRYNSWQ